jgi:hypothetical protein
MFPMQLLFMNTHRHSRELEARVSAQPKLAALSQARPAALQVICLPPASQQPPCKLEARPGAAGGAGR